MIPSGVYKFLLKKMGWKSEGEKVADRNCIYLLAPHTSIWDFAIGFMYYRAQGGHLKVMIKKEAFFFPVNLLLRSMGGFPIDRSNPQSTIKSLIRAMEDNKDRYFHLTICPEGTRKAVRKWKTGFHTIAKATGAPVYLTYIDFGRKRVGILPGRIELTDNARADMDRIQAIYAQQHFTGLHPEGYVTE